MELSILELFLNASFVVKSVILILILASILSWMVIFERWLYIKRVKQEFEEAPKSGECNQSQEPFAA